MADSNRKTKKPATSTRQTKTGEHSKSKAPTPHSDGEKPRNARAETPKQTASRGAAPAKPKPSKNQDDTKEIRSITSASNTKPCKSPRPRQESHSLPLHKSPRPQQESHSLPLELLHSAGARPKTYPSHDQTKSEIKRSISTSSATNSDKSGAHAGEDLDDELRQRVKNLKFSRQDSSANRELAKKIVDTVIRNLKDDSAFHWKSTALYSGSNYDKTKIVKANEFDYMFECDKIRCKEVNFPDVGPYCALEVTNKETADFVCNEKMLSPKLFKDHFAKIIRQSMKDDELKSCKIVVHGKSKSNNGLGPAVTVTVTSNPNFSIDFVPSVPIYDWPRAAKDWKHTERLKTAHIKEKIMVYAVPKIHPKEQANPDTSTLWRFSFSFAEKDLIYHNDYTDQDTCKKPVICLLKEDLEELKKKTGEIPLSSYFMKTVVLHLLDSRIGTLNWRESNLRECYVEALKLLLHYLKRRNIPHYFMPNVNLLDFADFLVRDLKVCEKFFKEKLRKYTRIPIES